MLPLAADARLSSDEQSEHVRAAGEAPRGTRKVVNKRQLLLRSLETLFFLTGNFSFKFRVYGLIT